MIKIIKLSNGLVGLQPSNLYEDRGIYKLDDLIVEVTTTDLVSIPNVPTNVTKQYKQSGIIFQKQHPTTGEIVSLEDWQTKYHTVLMDRDEEDYDTFVWNSKKSKQEYDELCSYKSIYTDPSIEYRPIEFQLLYQESIPDEYKDFIISSIAFSDNTKVITQYTPNVKKLLIKIAYELGYEIANNDNDRIGLKLYIHPSNSILRFSKVNGSYVGFDEKDDQICTRQTVGSLQDCIDAYQGHYTKIKTVLEQHKRLLGNPELNKQEILVKVNEILYNFDRVDYKVASKGYYRSLGKSINELKQML